MNSLHKLPKPEEQTPEEIHERPEVTTVALVVIAAGVVIYLLQSMQALFAPIAFGMLLFYALDPSVDALEKLRVPRRINQKMEDWWIEE